MRKIGSLLLTVFLSITCVTAQVVYPDYVDGKIFVKIKNDFNVKTRETVVAGKQFSEKNLPFELPDKARFGILKFKKAFDIPANDAINSVYLLEFSNINAVQELINAIKESRFVDYAERVPLDRLDLTPNDPSYSSMWHLARIDADLAWNFFSTGSNVVIAVIDDAVERNHPDLAANIWVNSGEIANNGVDDDNNGFIDDINGWDLVSNNNNPNPPSTDFDHGTHVAGIASAATNNGIGISSIGFSCKIMCLKATNNPNTISAGYQGIIYAANNRANIISMSWGSSAFSQTNQNIINYALERGCILVASAGNDNVSSERYPAAYQGVISVASTAQNDRKSSFSNFGPWVKVSAPGSSILSTVPFGGYGNKSGTSMSTPMVSGLLGLMKSLNPGMPNNELINCLYSSADNIDAPNPEFVNQLGAGRINAAKAMNCVAANLNRPPVADFTASATSITAGNSINFTDRSVYTPTSWSWSFAGGSPSTANIRNPVNIVYNTPGTYAVTLTVGNTNGSNSITRTSYITVNAPAPCTRVNLPLPTGWGFVSYSFQNNGGFLNGANSFGDRQKAMFFDLSTTNNTHMTGVNIAFSSAFSIQPNKLIRFRVYDGTNNTPGAELTSPINRTIGQIREDVLAQRYTFIDFSNNVELPASKKFFVSVDVSTLVWGEILKDSLNIFSNTIGQSSRTDAWEQDSDGIWANYSIAYNGQTNGLQLYIHPNVTPSPTRPVINPKNPELCANSSVAFNTQGSLQNGVSVLQWQVPGSTPQFINNQNAINPIYPTAGAYKAYLLMVGACGELRVDSTNVTVKPLPVINLTASKNPICAGETATLTASGAQGNYVWSPGTGLNTTTGAIVNANPATTISYNISGVTNGCTGNTVYELFVNGTTASVGIAAEPATISTPTSVTFTASGINGGSNPTYNFFVNNQSVQSGNSPVLTRTVSPGDKVKCSFTSNEACVIIKTVESNELTMGNSSLPVTLLYFRGVATSAGTLLNWATSAEINANYFDVEKSIDGINYLAIGKVDAKGNSTQLSNYSFTDNRQLSGRVNYYRLKMVDRDGTFTYSKVVVISLPNNSDKLLTELIPNPALQGKMALLNLEGISNGKIGVTIYNINGALVKQYETIAFNNRAQLNIESDRLSTGTYMVVVKDAQGKVIDTKKWIITR